MPTINFGENITPATKKQQDYIQILSDGLEFDRKTRNTQISYLIGRAISYLDELSKPEASIVIATFKKFKENGL